MKANEQDYRTNDGIGESKSPNSFEQGIEELGDKVTKLASRSAERLADSTLITEAKEKGSEYFHEVEKYIKNNPIQASIISAGLGFWLARNLTNGRQ